MPTPVRIEIGGMTLRAELNDTPTAHAILSAAPLEVHMGRWGDEYYGACDIEAALEDRAREAMEIGEIAFWPPGNALCIFFGPTPASTDDEPRAASPVNPVGWLLDDPTPLKAMGSSISITLEQA